MDGVMGGPDVGSSRKNDDAWTSEQPRTIPIYVRLVPRDIWLRMHVDSRATIGSVKDAVLDRIQYPPQDPSMNPYFYEDARSAMSRQSANINEMKSLPKAFLGRIPKRSVAELLRAEVDADAASLFSSSTGKAVPRRLPTPKSVPTAAQARAILGGDAGLGGRGSQGFVCADYGGSKDESGRLTSAFTSHLSTPELRVDSSQRFSPSPSPSPYHRSSGGTATEQSKTVTSNRRSSNPSSIPSQRTGGDRSSSSGKAGAGELNSSGSLATKSRSGSDAGHRSSENWEGKLTGNEEAMRLEEAAMLQVRAAEAKSVASPFLEHDPHASTYDARSVDTHSSSHDRLSSTHHSERMDDGDEEGAERDQDDSDDEDAEKAYADLVSRSGRLSVQSSSSSNVSLEGEKHAEASEEGRRDRSTTIDGKATRQKRSFSHTDVRTTSPTSSRSGGGERARSGTIMPGDMHRNAAVNAVRDSGVHGSSTPSTIHTSSSTDLQIPEGEVLQLPNPRLPSSSATPANGPTSHLRTSNAESLNTTTDSKSRASTPSHFGTSAVASGSAMPAARRLAGIYTDEISSWRDAQHPQARFFSIHSYSNGHVLEDWRTVAAFRIRPFELLEVQFADPRDKVHLPRVGEASGMISRKDMPKMDKDDEKATFGLNLYSSSSTTSSFNVNPALDSHYLEPYAECWCFVFKRGSGTSRTQRAGLGLWKLRWVCLHSNRLFIFRTKPPRYAFSEAISVWNLDGIEAVLSERADGATRPVLIPLTGQSKDILTITFRSTSLTSSTVVEEHHEGTRQPSVSLRFITDLDNRSFFRSCSRAYYRAMLRREDVLQASLVYEWRRKALARATIAGMGGTVIPGKAARRGGRNALARKRLRPSGVRRDFDDADRWSSNSEMEDDVSGDTGEDNEQFCYADALSNSSQADVSGLPFTPTPSVPSMSFFNSAVATSTNELSPAFSVQSTPRIMARSDTADASPASVARRSSGRFAPSPSIDSPLALSSRHRSPSSNDAAMFASKSEQGGNVNAIFSSSSSQKVHHSSSMRLLSPKSTPVGLGVSDGDSLISIGRSHEDGFNAARPIASSHVERPLVSSSSGHVERNALEQRLPSSPSARFEKTRPATSNAVVSSLNQTPSSPNDDDVRPVFSPSLEEEESPAARALNSFLSQRSASTRSNLNRARSTTIAVSPQRGAHDDTMARTGQGSAEGGGSSSLAKSNTLSSFDLLTRRPTSQYAAFDNGRDVEQANVRASATVHSSSPSSTATNADVRNIFQSPE